MKLSALLLLSSLAFAADSARIITAEERQSAYSVACNWISARLKAPSTARFTPIEEAVFTDGATKHIRKATWAGAIDVRLYVDAQNSYGAMLRKYWYCKVGRDIGNDQHLAFCVERR